MPSAATFEERLRHGKALDEVALHAGDVFGNDKVLTMQRLDVWMPEAWTPEAGLKAIARVCMVNDDSVRKTCSERPHRDHLIDIQD